MPAPHVNVRTAGVPVRGKVRSHSEWAGPLHVKATHAIGMCGPTAVSFQVREIREPHVSYHAGSNSLASGVDADCLRQDVLLPAPSHSPSDRGPVTWRSCEPSNACRSIRIRGSHSIPAWWRWRVGLKCSSNTGTGQRGVDRSAAERTGCRGQGPLAKNSLARL